MDVATCIVFQKKIFSDANLNNDNGKELISSLSLEQACGSSGYYNNKSKQIVENVFPIENVLHKVVSKYELTGESIDKERK